MYLPETLCAWASHRKCAKTLDWVWEVLWDSQSFPQKLRQNPGLGLGGAMRLTELPTKIAPEPPWPLLDDELDELMFNADPSATMLVLIWRYHFLTFWYQNPHKLKKWRWLSNFPYTGLHSEDTEINPSTSLNFTSWNFGIIHYVSKHHSKSLFNAQWNLFWWTFSSNSWTTSVVPWNSLERKRHNLKFHGIPWNFVQSQSSMELHGTFSILPKSMESHGIP